MPAPKKAEGKGVSGGDEALKIAERLNDTESEEVKMQLGLEASALKVQIENENKMTGQFNDERLRINYFWLISKKELEDKQAELRNKERELQDLQEKHQIEIKIYKQRCKHLMF